jgi:two-component system response regulator RegA
MSAVATGPSLLIADDDAAFRAAMADAFRRRGFCVLTAAHADEADAVARQIELEYALVDVRMPGRSGLELVASLHAHDDGTRIVVLSGYGTISSAVTAMRAGAVDYLTKPTSADACERALLGKTPIEPTAATDDPPSLDRVEWEYLHRVLDDCGGNVSEAARRLRMHRRSLQRRLARNPPAR